ncbi:MAG: hypothetical protein ACK5WZ_15700 [Pseudobdellovibrionaceae bacterium]
MKRNVKQFLAIIAVIFVGLTAQANGNHSVCLTNAVESLTNIKNLESHLISNKQSIGQELYDYLKSAQMRDLGLARSSVQFFCADDLVAFDQTVIQMNFQFNSQR